MDAELARVVVVGSHPVVLEYVSQCLVDAGFRTVACLGADEGAAALENAGAVDAIVLGGPSALAGRDRLLQLLKRNHPFARIIIPERPDEVVERVIASFGGIEV
jgi:hypothetical protein